MMSKEFSDHYWISGFTILWEMFGLHEMIGVNNIYYASPLGAALIIFNRILITKQIVFILASL